MMADPAPVVDPPVVTDPPVVDPPVTDPPVTDPPVTDPPQATVIPVTDPPVTDPPAGNWANTAPDDWRELLAGEDEARLNTLKRFTDFDAMVDNLFVSREKIRIGQIEALEAPGEEATDEQWTEYRQAHEIPEKAEDYSVQLDDGLVIGDEDQEILNHVYPVAHELNLPTGVVSKLANALLDGQAQQFHGLEIQQEEFRKEADALVKGTWKGDYEVNKNLISASLINSLPESVRENFAHATLADGRKIMNSPEMLISMADWARKINPSAAVVPNNANPMQAILTEIATLEKRMGDREWFKDQAAQDRYKQLITARDNLKAES